MLAHLRVLARGLVCLAIGFLPFTATAGAEVDRALSWLGQQPQANGSLVGESGSIATPLQARSETLVTLKQFGTTAASVADSIAAQADSTTEYTARKITALAPYGRDVSASLAALAALQNGDGGFGSEPGYASNALDTAYALLAWKAAGSPNASAVSRALGYLTGAQGADGSFGINEQSSVFVTALALQALDAFASTYSLTTPIASAKTWLVGQQTGSAYGTVLDNAVATLALAGATLDSTAFGGAQSALKASQAADGSWSGDPYLTAIAIRALAATASAPPPATTGQVSGSVVDQTTSAALSGVQVQLSGPQSASATTDASGGFTAVGLAPGTYAVQFSKAGYATVSLNVAVTAGVVSNLGVVRLQISTTTAAVQGTVRDGATGQPIAGATVAVSGGPSATTDAGGAYQLAGLTPGSVVITVSQAGYDTVTVNASLGAGVVTSFSPSLYAPGQGPTSAALTGRVVDRATSAAVAGATVKVGSATATTSATGDFSLASLAAGTVTIEISAAGYSTATFSATLALGTNNAGTIAIDKTPSAITVSGKVTDAASAGTGIGGVTLHITGTTLSATTDASGNYAIAGVTQTQFTMAVSAAGYQSKNVSVTLTALANATVDVTLDRTVSTGIDITQVTPDKAAYDPYTLIELAVGVHNATAQTAVIGLNTTILDPLGNAIMDIAGTTTTIAASSSVNVSVDTHVSNQPAGNYSVVVHAFDPASGALLAEGTASFAINAVTKLGGGITLDPPIAQAGTNQAIHIAANLANQGNLPIGAGNVQLTVTLDVPDPSVAPKPTTELLPGGLVGSPLNNPVGGRYDAQGNFYTVNKSDRKVLKRTPDGQVVTIAQLPVALFSPTIGVSVMDSVADSVGNVYVLNSDSEIFRIAPDGTLARIATNLSGQRRFDRDPATGNFQILQTTSSGYRMALVSPSGQTISAALADGINAPMGIVQGADGALYIPSRGDNSIWRMTTDGVSTPFATTGLSDLRGISVGSGGTLYVLSGGGLAKVSTTGQVTPFASGLPNGQDVAVDAQGNAFVSHTGDNTIVKVLPDGSKQVFARSIAGTPRTMAYDAAGTLYVAGDDGNLVQFDASQNRTVMATGLSSPRGLAVGFNGDVFVANFGNGRITRSGTSTAFAQGLANPWGLAYDGSGTLYASEYSSHRIVAFDAAGQKTVVAPSMLTTSPRAVYVAPGGDRYILSADVITRMPTSGAGSVVASGGFYAYAFAPANDGGFFIEESTLVRRMSPTGALSVYKSGLPSLSYGIVADASNNLLVSDLNGKKILRIDGAGNVTTFATVPESVYALIDDQAGGLYTTMYSGNLGRVSASGVFSYITTSAPGFSTSLALDAAGNRLYLLNGQGIRAFDLATKTATNVLSRTSLASITFSGGQILATDSTRAELISVTPQGQVTPLAAGFSYPQALAWDGTKLYISDSTHVLSLVPGAYPQALTGSSSARNDIKYVNGTLFGVSGAVLYSLVPGVDAGWKLWTTQPAGNALGSLAARADGALTVASDSDSHFYSFDASKQVIASYAGISSPSGIAVDAAGNVYVNSSSYSQVVRISADGLQSSIVTVGLGAQGLSFDASGQLYATTNGNRGVATISPSGIVTTIATSTGTSALSDVAVTPAGIFAVEPTTSMIRKVSGAQIVPFAAGISNPANVRIDAAGSVLVANIGNGTVTRFINGLTDTRASGMIGPSSIAFAADGSVLVGGNNGHLYQVDAAGAATVIANLSDFLGGAVAVTDMAVDQSSNIAVVMASRNELERLRFVPAQPIPPAGTVVYNGTASFGGLAVDSVPVPVDFGSWLPPYAGDYKLSIRAQDGTAGEALNVLHVGPHATAEITTAAPTVPPGNSPVAVTVSVEGADFTSLAKVDGTNVSVAVSTGVYPVAMGADAQGNVYAATSSSAVLYKYTPDGVRTTFFTLPTGFINMRGTVPVDNRGNLYVGGGTGAREVYRVTPDGTGTMIGTLPEALVSLGIGSNDELFALTSARLARMEANGTLTTLTGVATPYALTVDGRNNVYVQLSNNTITQLRPDGTLVTVLKPDSTNQPQFEYEGMNVAGDCADNLFVTPTYWPALGQSGEEYSLIQLVTRTGRAAQVLDGRKLNPQLTDLDFIVYDRFTGTLLMWTDLTGGRMYRIPVTCGAISTDLHMVFPGTQPTGAFSVAPKATFTRTDGSIEYVWSLKDVTNLGKTVGLTTTLQGLKLGDVAPVASEAFLVFQNTFVAGDIKLPLKVPTVGVDGMVDIGVGTDRPQYEANTDVLGTVQLVNRDTFNPKSGVLTVEITDQQGVRLGVVLQQPQDLAAGQTVEVSPPFNTGTYLTGTYKMKATLADASGLAIAAGSTSFDIVASPVSLISSVSTDKQTYDALDTATITARVRNVSLNAIASDLTVRVTVKDPSGQTVLSGSAPISILVPQALKDSTFQLRLNGAAAGNYAVDETLVDAGGTTIDARSASFAVLSTADTGSGLRGAISTTKVANQGDPVTITATLRNQGNAALTNLPVTIKVVNPASGALIQQWTSNVTIPVGGEQQVAQIWSTTGVAPGAYVAAASASFGGRDIALGQDTIAIGVIQPFSFAPKTNVALNTVVESSAVTIGGIVAPAPISITEGEYRIGTGGWTGAPGLVRPGDPLTVRVTSASSFDTTTTAVVTVAGYSTSFAVTTVNPDVSPDPFAFTALTNVPLGTLQTSNTVTIASIDIPVAIAITGGEYSINGGAWTSAAGTVAAGNTVAVRVTSAATLGTTVIATLTVSDFNATFSVTTTLEDRSPDAFAFTPQNNVPVSSLRTSNTVTISGINVTVPVSVVGGEYQVNDGAFTSAAGTVSSGNRITVRHTSSASFSTTVTTKLTVSDFTAAFESSTEGEDTTPEPFSFREKLDVPLLTEEVSEFATITGINTTVPISVQGGEYSVNDGAFTAVAGTVKSNDTVRVRQTSSSSFATKTTATLTVSQLSAPFSVTTKAAADVTTVPTFAPDARVLVLLSCKLKGADNADDDATCVAQRRAFLDDYLTQLGILHTIVTATEDFRSEFRSGRYNTYWISGGAIKLKDTLGEEVREATFRGETLIVDGVHDERNRVLDEALGVFYKGKPAALTTVTMPGPVLPVGTFTVSGTAPIRVDLLSAQRLARFNTGDSAISSDVFGYGKSMLFSFDLTGTLFAQSASALLRDMVGSAVDFATPAVPTTFTGGAYVPLSFTVKNAEPVSVDLEITATLPTGFMLAAGAPPATLTGSDVTWHVSLAAGASQTLDWAVRTPDATGSYAIAMVVKQLYGTSVVQLGTPSIPVEVRGIDSVLPAVIAQLQVLTLASSSERNARDAAVTNLASAQSALNAARWQDAIGYLVTAVEKLDAITSVSMAPYQASIDNVTKEAERRWWAALPPCPGASPCRTTP